MPEYFTYLTDMSLEKIRELKENLASERVHPNEVKKDLARAIVGAIHGKEVAREMQEKFESVFRERKAPEDCPTYTFRKGEPLISVLVSSQLLSSKGEARRMESQGAISLVGGDKITDVSLPTPEEFRGKALRVGKKKFLRLL